MKQTDRQILKESERQTDRQGRVKNWGFMPANHDGYVRQKGRQRDESSGAV